MEEKFDAIIVGAGAAGLGAAYRLAKNGFNVVVLERGQRIGAKNVYGGRIYSHVFEKEIPEFTKEAPVERWVKKERLTFMNESDAVSLELFSSDQSSFIAILSKFNEWLGKKVEEAGGLVIPGFKVDDLIIEDGAVKGIVAGEEKLYSDVVIDAEGINPILAMKAGLRGDWKPNQVAVGVKEVIKLSEEKINDLFDLNEGEGMANLFLGYPTKYGLGGGFLYTNKDTISLGIVVRIDSAIAKQIAVYDIVEDFRLHPFIARILKEGSPIEYSAHLVPEGYHVPSKLAANGILLAGDVAGFVLNRGLTIRGVDLAFLSGLLAAETVKEAHEAKDFSETTLKAYESKLRNSIVINELEAFKKASTLLSNLRFYETYPQLVCEVLKEAYTIGENSQKIYPILREKMKGRISLLTLIRDLISAVRNL
ncbi:MAG: FAD-dependent oxidoreductase [Archaeoglobus sp.]|nr:FAD-dependent oxidoreductase [Archaeoglobus sp.]